MKFLIFLFILAGCSKSEPNLEREQILAMARKGDPKLEIVLPKTISEAVVDCNHYEPKCQNGYKVIVMGLEMIGLYYLSQDDAKTAAKKIKGYRTRNWVFDDVTGEPILERFVKKHLEAQPAE